jgi:polar amino acid transport system substrate-binding protein
MRRRLLLAGLVGAGVPGIGAALAQPVGGDVRASLAPTGALRVAINYGNAALARRDASGSLSGVSVDIAQELARRLGLTLVMVPFDAAGKVTAAAGTNVWDVAFLARDPERAKEITFTAAYVVINGNYVVAKASRFHGVADVDQSGVSVAVSTNSAYDLYLSRALKHAKLIHAGSTPETIALFRAEHIDVLAGVKRALDDVVANDSTLRMIPEPFMAINQAMGTPAGRPAGAAWLSAFVEDIKASGFVAQALQRNGQGDAMVAPPA